MWLACFRDISILRQLQELCLTAFRSRPERKHKNAVVCFRLAVLPTVEIQMSQIKFWMLAVKTVSSGSAWIRHISKYLIITPIWKEA